ncbi:DUF3089 domain-containing protein [Gammaproteobacteria bacterium]|nr:DUF3089 domain-containing protein [Gammaproteobacteria bacterium]
MDKSSPLVDKFFASVTPNQPFSRLTSPQPPDYGDLKSWAAFPGKKSVALLEPNTESQNKLKEVDCFFIHPTGFFLKEWNFDMNTDSATSQRTDLMLATQATVFNKECNIYAPEYRQATFAAISQNLGRNSSQALDLAYLDVKEAFRNFLENYSDGKPFFLASHSQGSLHAQRLLTEIEFKKVYSKQLIAAYLIGYPLEEEYLRNLGASVCTRFLDEGVIIQFQTVGEDVIRSRLKFWLFDGKEYCLKKINQLATTNPISFSKSEGWVKNEINSLLMPKISGISPLFDYGATNKNNSYVREINYADDQNFYARIGKSGFLETKGSTIDRILKNDYLGEKDLHIWDYQIFWNHLRKDVETKVNKLKGNT